METYNGAEKVKCCLSFHKTYFTVQVCEILFKNTRKEPQKEIVQWHTIINLLKQDFIKNFKLTYITIIEQILKKITLSITILDIRLQ